jgi:hypothetical protein
MDDTTAFRITYDGPALEHHQMDARELAPALLAVADLLETSCKALYGDKAKLQISVKGSFQTGSFNIDFVTAVNWLKTVRDLFSGEHATAMANGLVILGALGFVGKKGLAQALVWLRGRNITHVSVDVSAAKIYIGSEFFDVERDTVDLLRDVPVRQAFARVLSPLDRSGISIFAVGEGSALNLVIDESERAFFDPPATEDVLLVEDTRTLAFSIVSLTFKEDNKWRLSDGSATISATISDSQFLSAVDQNLASFSKGDVLVCSVRIKQWQTQSGARTEYDVVTVQKHLRAATQITLPGLHIDADSTIRDREPLSPDAART